jgi:uncharacterized protein (TIGR03083 family)
VSESQELAAKLTAEGLKIGDFFESLAADQWARQVYTEGTTWTVRDILAHLMTSERAFVKLFEQIRQGGAGVSEDFVIDRYNASQQARTRQATPGELLEAYRALRAQMVEWVSKLQPAELELTGRHPFLGITSLREMIKLIYIHNQTHLRDMRNTLR